ncbi:MAG: DUF2169 domain-containing protein [Desulfobacteraceae bacterium]|nr:DUF2169 domain-containing protein [Desulfobacteraceae bacterium]
MEIINDTPFTIAPIPGRIPFPGHSLTFAVKGAFALEPGKKAALACDQISPAGDEYFPGDQEGTGSLFYGSDFMYFKPRSDLLLAGTCRTPGGRPEERCPVTFGVGAWEKTLVVRGDRSGQGRPGFREVPGPFAEMALTHENSFGPLPAIGPQRLKRMGSFGPKWKDERWPWFPEDFDWRYCNQALPDQQVAPYLKGDESLYFKHLHPQYPEFRSSLPGIRVKCFIQKQAPEKSEPSIFAEVPMNLDTLWADMDSRTLVLVWRGWTRTLSAEYEELDHLYILSEPTDTGPQPLDHYREICIRALDRENRKWEPAPEAPVEPPQPHGPEPVLLRESDPEVKIKTAVEKPMTEPPMDLRKQLKTQTAALMAQLGLNLDGLDPKARQGIESRQEALLDRLTETDPARIQAGDLEDFEKQKIQALEELGIDPARIPAPTQKAKMEQVRVLKAMGMDEAQIGALSRDPSFLEFQGIMVAALPKMGLDPENLDPFILEIQKFVPPLKTGEDQPPKKGDASEEPALPPEPAEPVGRVLTRQRVEERAAVQDSFKGEDFRGLDLSGLDLSGLDFSGADFSGSHLTGTRFLRSNLGRADFTRAGLEDADLTAADCTEACFDHAVLCRAALEDTVFEKAAMMGADFTDGRARDACFVQADLAGAEFSRADLMGADFSGAVLDKARFSEAVLKEARLEKVRCRDADFFKADLTELRASGGSDFSGSRFSQVKGRESIWQKAILKETDFSFSDLEGANFREADLANADLTAADMKFARFIKAGLARARLIRANLFQGCLEEADLDCTDLRGASLYGVEFLNAKMRNTLVAKADLTMTKLDKKERT